MMESESLIEQGQASVLGNYARYPLLLVRGEGVRVWDREGREYLDFVSGLAVNNLGHCHPRVVEAIRRQAGELLHVSNLYWIEPQIALARFLTQNSFADKCFFCNSGAEANEAALKLARRAFSEQGEPHRNVIVSMEGSFHGRTFATLTVTGQEKYHKGFAPLLPGVRYVPFNDAQALDRAVDDRTCAVLVEPIQGEGGVRVPDEGYLAQTRRLCNERGALLIFDEVQTGMGRTGRLFCYEHDGVTPDVMTLAKSLAGGVAIGAMLTTDALAPFLGPGSHASTFGGNPLACAAGVAATQALIEEGMLQNCAEVGGYLMKELRALQNQHSFIKEVRGRGLLVGMELSVDGAPFVALLMEKGILINCVMGNVLRFLPPLIVTTQDVDRVVTEVDRAFRAAPRP